MANEIWIGAAQDVAQVVNCTVGGTWATADILRCTIGGQAFIDVTVGTASATTDVAAILANAINASDLTSPLADESYTMAGQASGEFLDVIASVSGSTVILTSSIAGVDFTATFSVVSSTSGTFGAVSTPTAATGKNWFDNTANWESGSVPGSGDVAVFANGSVDCIRGLDTPAALAGVTRLGSYTGNIGLAKTNKTRTGYPYPEYRNRFLDVPSAAAVIRIGDGSGTNTGRTCINNGSTTAFYYVNDTAKQRDGLNPIELVSTTGGSEFYITKGDVDIGERYGLSADIEHIRVYGGNVRVDGVVALASELIVAGGVVETHMALTNFTLDLEVKGGKLIHHDGACPAIVVSGGTLDYRSDGALTSVTVLPGGALTFDGDSRTKTVTDILLHDSAKFSDEKGVAIPSGDYHFVQTRPSVNTVLPRNYKYSPTAL